MNTVLITGCSTGFGRAIALRFLDHGWNVVATMRNPAASTLPASDRLRVLPLDVTDPASIAAAVAAAGEIDVLVNNAGIGWLNAVEATPMATVRAIFETNLFGPVAMMQAVLPQMRERRAGVIVNVSSSVTLAPMPLLSVYSASKHALNGLTRSAAFELAEFGIRSHLVLPGYSPETAFSDSTRGLMTNADTPDAYAGYMQAVMAELMANAQGEVTHADDVAAAVWQAATDPASPATIPAGADAVALAEAA